MGRAVGGTIGSNKNTEYKTEAITRHVLKKKGPKGFLSEMGKTTGVGGEEKKRSTS